MTPTSSTAALQNLLASGSPPTARAGWRALLPVVLLLAAARPGFGQAGLPSGGQPVVKPESLLTTPVGGLERTGAAARVVPVSGQPFSRALRVTLRTSAAESNATQLTLPTIAPVERGDTLLASFYLRGTSAKRGEPAQVMFLFERSQSPWTKSATQGATTSRNPNRWKRVLVPFTAAESYRPGEAMVSLRFAFGPQTVLVGGLSVVSYGRQRTLDELVALAAEASPLGAVRVAVNLKDTKQTLLGFGGNFCQPRYGSTEPMDPVGEYNLKNLRVVHARIGLPLNWWTPERGVYRDEGQARAAMLQMQAMARRGIPITLSIWEGPLWMLGGEREQSGRTLPPERYADCIEAVAQFLVTARDKYGAEADTFSFNEPDYGVNFRFTPRQMADFIRQAGPRFAALKLKTKFLVGDTANGTNFVDYARPLLEDPGLTPYLGPLAFHSWDALGTPDERYAAIAALGRRYRKPVWCLEAGHDAQLWQQPNPWASWENGLRTALAYEKTLRLSGAALMDYWTYQNNYPLVSQDGKRPYPVFHVIRQMELALPPGARIAAAASESDDLRALASAGPGRGRFSVLLVNPSGAGTVTLTGLPPRAAVTVTQSTAARQRSPVAAPSRVDAKGRLVVPVPSRSVVTVVGGPAGASAADR